VGEERVLKLFHGWVARERADREYAATRSSPRRRATGTRYDPDSRKAYRIYTVCVVQAENLESLLRNRGVQDAGFTTRSDANE
jgi:hypothetical protein